MPAKKPRSDHPFRRTYRPPAPERDYSPLVDCGARALGTVSCGACDRCLHVQMACRADHPARLEFEELGRL